MVKEARQYPDGWVYEIIGGYGPNDAVPPDAIKGGWEVDENGQLTGEFMANPNFRG